MHVLDWPNPFYLDSVEYMDLWNESEARHADELNRMNL